MKQIFQSVFAEGRKLYTLNSTPQQNLFSRDSEQKALPKRLFDEEIVVADGKEYRSWNPLRSKLAAAIVKGLPELQIKSDSKILYLGAAHGYTPSFISDIASEGVVFAVDFAPRVVRDLVFVAEKRKNIIPLLADANHPEAYYNLVGAVDIVYQDVAQKNQLEIFTKNCSMFLKPGGFGMLALKARSIDVLQQPQGIFLAAKRELEKKLTVIDYRLLSPLQKDHAFFVCWKN
ncbi:fibrillarin-like rRNA/tRNA 2'-O-methyltransferase [Candidatus Woesearchaeota archaeon]|nr:fibrillarin-like rRNA/tRNA 2'-O-methyltransferase [Candidatus Woesearchaeota archaeon]